MHCCHSEELPGVLLAQEVPAATMGDAQLPEASERPADSQGLLPAAGGEEEEGGGGGREEEGGGGAGKVGRRLVLSVLVGWVLGGGFFVKVS